MTASLTRFLAVLGAALAIDGLTLAHQNGAALTVGIAVGVFFLLRGMALGGGLGNARNFGSGPADVSARVGICLAAAGIASASLGHDPPFPRPFLILYAVFLVIGSVAAVALAGWALRRGQ